MRVINGMARTGFAVSAAILVHARSGAASGEAAGFATLHAVRTDEDRPEIQAGTVLGAGQLEQMLVGLAPERGLTFIEDRILASSSNALVWWRRPTPARMWFNTSEDERLGQRQGMAPQPGLVFATSGDGWSVWAVKGSERPDRDTAMYQAPYFNVSNTGAICVGNVTTPRGYAASVADGYEAAFWGSRFTHPNVHIRRQLTLWRGGCSALWVSMLAGKHKKFPDSALTPLKRTLGDVIEQIAGRKARRGV